VECGDGHLPIYPARPADLENLTVVYSIDIRSALDSIGLTFGSFSDCSFRTRFNQDFSRMVVTGSLDDGTNHAALLDLATGVATDLTEPRQGAGISGGDPLDESGFMFEPLGPGFVLGDRVIVGGSGQAVAVNTANPTDTAPFPGGQSAVNDVLTVAAGADYNDSGQGRSLLSPDGLFVLTDTGDSGIYPLANGLRGEFQEFDDDDCRNGFPQGWRDPRTAVVSREENWYLVTIDGAGVKIACTAIFPETDRDIVDGRMRLDGQAVFVTVDGPGGDEGYVADLNDPGGEPVPGVPSLVMDEDWRVYANRAGA
jgi:hypothetical protein